MTRRYRLLAWSAAIASYLLIVLGAVVRITGSGLGCGEDWPVCHGRLFPSLADITTFIEWNHRLVAAIVSTLVVLLALVTWLERRGERTGDGRGVRPSRGGYLALALLIVQVLLGAITVKLRLPPWTVILHLGTAMMLLAVVLICAIGPRTASTSTVAVVAAALGFVTVLLGGLTANLGAATACAGFPLCNGQAMPVGNYLQHIHWTHRVLAYGLFVYLLVWAVRSRQRGPVATLGLATVHVVVAATMVLLTVPPPLQVVHAALGTALWAALVVVTWRGTSAASRSAPGL